MLMHNAAKTTCNYLIFHFFLSMWYWLSRHWPTQTYKYRPYFSLHSHVIIISSILSFSTKKMHNNMLMGRYDTLIHFVCIVIFSFIFVLSRWYSRQFVSSGCMSYYQFNHICHCLYLKSWAEIVHIVYCRYFYLHQ